MAVDILKENIFAEGDFYEGDLLKSVLTVEATYWENNYQDWKEVNDLFILRREELEQYDTSKGIKQGWLDSYREFSQIHK
jgi:hypothetical protein